MPIEGREADAIQNLIENWQVVRHQLEILRHKPGSGSSRELKQFQNEEDIQALDRLEKDLKNTEELLQKHGIDPKDLSSRESELTGTNI